MTGTGGLAGRAARQTSLNNHYTPEDVGPGAYVGHTQTKVRPSYAAFSSSKARNVSSTKNSTPGPGAYGGGPQAKKPVAASNCFANKVSRFAPSAPGSTVFKASSVADNPGPGSYQAMSISGTSSRQAPRTSGQGPQLIVNAQRSKPSIPRPSQSYGYLEGENKELVLQMPPEKVYSGLGADTVGPAAYNPSKNMTQNRYTTTDFGKSNATRKLWEPNKTRDNWQPSHANPGPGYYNPNVKGVAKKGDDDEGVRGTSNFASKVPMAHEAKPKHTLPGPGVYQPYHGSTVEEKYNATPSAVQGFGSTAARKGWQRSMEIPFNTPTNHTTPGPGSYGEKRTAFNKNPRKMLIDEPIGFSATDQRPCVAHKPPTGIAKNPGPGSYLTSTSVGTLSGDLIRKTVGRNGIFGSTTERFFRGDFDKPPEGIAGHNPGPGAYEEPRQTGEQQPRAKRNQTSVFRAAGNRFSRETQARPPAHVKIVGTVDNPPVGAYNIPSSFGKVTESKSAPAKDKAKPFSSTATRFDNKKFMGVISPRTPGPGTYGEESVKASSFALKGKQKRPMAPPGNLGMDARFKSGANSYKNTNTTSSDLGPGSYQTEGNMTTRSFNITMAPS